MNLSKPWRNALLSVHIVTTVGVLGTDLVLLTLGLTGLLGSEPETVYPAAAVVGTRLVAPLAVAALATGLLLAFLTPHGLLRYWWTAIKLVITAGLTAAVLFVLLPALGAAAEAALAGQEPTAQRLPLVVAPALASVLLVVAVLLGVFKPAWRLRARRPTASSAVRVATEQ